LEYLDKNPILKESLALKGGTAIRLGQKTPVIKVHFTLWYMRLEIITDV
jgi:hypothetical protein